MKLCIKCQYEFNTQSWDCPICDFAPPYESGFPLFAPELNDSAEGFDVQTFEQLYRLEEKNFWFRARNRLIAWAIGKYFPHANSLLEIGCGTGFVLSAIEARFPAIVCAGSEIHAAGLAYAKSRVRSSPLWQMDAREIPFLDEFDLIGAFDVLEHIKEDEVVLQQIHRAVRPGGGILLTVPQHPSLWSHADELACHQRRYTAKELEAKVRRAGFDVVRSTSFVSFLLPLMAVSRLKERYSESKSKVELDLPSGLNLVLEAVMGLETACIRAGVNFPAGGSRLLIATRPGQ